MNDFSKKCFVCGINIESEAIRKNKELNLPVCENCEGSEQEKQAVNDLTEGLAEGFVCGCI